MNLDNVHTLHGKPIKRVDEIGHFVMRYSDDGGKSWSAQRYEVRMRMRTVVACACASLEHTRMRM